MKRTQKKNRWIRFTIFTLLFTIFSICMMSGVLAKYISQDTGNGSANIAKWGFKGINQVNVFDTSYKGTQGDSNTVAASNGTTKIVAPGTTGSFSFTFKDGSSEVASKITVMISETNEGNIPLVYKYNNAYYSDVLEGTVYLKLPNANTFTEVAIGTLSALGTAVSTNSSYAFIAPNTPYQNLTGGTIEWFWAFEQATDDQGTGIGANDIIDTGFGTSTSAVTVTLNVTVRAEQID